MLRGAIGRATGWFARARRLLERDGRDCVECGYLLVARVFEREALGARDAAIAAAEEAAAIGERFGDADLMALAALDQGRLLIEQQRISEGLGLLDEAMVEVTAGELSPIVSGLVYSGVIVGCQAAFEPRRVGEWTAALAQWCEQQPDMVRFAGTCSVHRAEVMQLRGAWPDALREARRAAMRCALASNERATAQAAYRRGEIHRLQGDFTAAAAAYRDAQRGGVEAQPGLALLRLAEGDSRGAAAAIRRELRDTPEPSRRATLMPAEVEITRAVGDVASARRACEELQELAACWPGPMMGATAAFARGAVPARRRGRRRGARGAASGVAVVVRAWSTVRGGTRSRADRSRLPRDGRPRDGRAGARGRPRRVRMARRGTGRHARRLAHRGRRVAR
jgi:hypothetical protein